MKTYPINNINNVSNIIGDLLADDITYLVNHSRFVWGDHSDNLINKINQYEEIQTVPIFSNLLLNGFYIATAYLEYVRPTFVKSIYNISIKTGIPNAACIVVPLYVPSSGDLPTYQIYNQEQFSQFTDIKDAVYVSEIITEIGNQLLDYETNLTMNTPLVINSPGAWSGIRNCNETDHVVYLRLSFGGNPSFESIVSAFGD